MSENKFIKRLKGEQTAKSVLEIKNESAKTSFANMPQGTSNAINVYSDHRGNATAVLEGTDIWKLNNSLFVVTPDALGDGRDFTSTYTVAGSSLWVNATYTFAQPKIFTGATQWVLKLCGHSLLSRLSNTIGFSLIIKFGNTTTITKSFAVSENAFEFCKEFIIDFSESEQTAVKVANGDTMTVQLLCADATASATIYNGMTTLVAQQRRVDGDAVASDLHTFEDLEVEIAEIQDDIEAIQDDIADIQDDIIDTNGKIIVRSATIPTASADLVGKVYQYAGTTNGQYTHNYIYECVAGETTYDGLIGFEPTKIAFDYTKGNLAEFFSDTTPNFAQVTHGTFTYLAAGDLWAISGQDANENVLFDNYKLYTQDLEDAGFVFINPPQDYTDGEVIDYTVTFTPQPTTYSWVRVDVQPDRITQIQALQADVSDIQALIPAQASPTNQLGDKNFINSSIATNTANFIGTFNSVAELEAYSGTVTNNDYAFVIGTDSAGNTTYNRYKYNANTQQWIYEYTLNNSSFTANQWAAINSGVTASDVSKARSAVQPSDVGNGTIKITQGGETKGTFTTNQGNNATIDIDAGGGSGLNVGDIFLTMRNDNELNGAVECDGSTYNTTDFTGGQSIGQLLEDGKVPYVSMAVYASTIATQGWCDKFGWDGTGNTQFKVPTLSAYVWQKLQLAIKGSIGTSGSAKYFVATQSSFSQRTYPESGSFSVSVANDQTIPGASVDVTSEDVAQQRCMVQLAISATDEALETCTGVLADVAALKYDYVVDFQAPTAENNYTWYRKYKSGWIEQGGQISGSSSVTKPVTLPVAMADVNYYVGVVIESYSANATYNIAVKNRQSTGFDIGSWYNSNSALASGKLLWTVKGMAAA